MSLVKHCFLSCFRPVKAESVETAETANSIETVETAASVGTGELTESVERVGTDQSARLMFLDQWHAIQLERYGNAPVTKWLNDARNIESMKAKPRVQRVTHLDVIYGEPLQL